MVSSWIIPGLGAAFVTAWTYHSGKFLGLPALKHQYGIPTAIGLVLLAAYMHKKSGMMMVVHPMIPHIPSRWTANYAHDPNPVGQLPLGAYTGPGLDQKNVPESAIVDFPDYTARRQLGGI